ncbi:hypothetical protein [Mucilaginibacter sp.]
MYTLITGAASARAYQLKNQQEGRQVLLGDYLELPAVMLRAGSMLQLPAPQQASYAHLMLTLCLDRQIDRVLILNPGEEVLLKEAELLFAEYGIELNYCGHDV